jgi:hypothetical protein
VQEAVGAFSGLLGRALGSSSPQPEASPLLQVEQVPGHFLDRTQNPRFPKFNDTINASS